MLSRESLKYHLKTKDMFKQNMNWRWPKRNKRSDKTDYVFEQGSWFGGINTIGLILSLIGLLTVKSF